MNIFTGLNIEQITIIIHKYEKEPLNFKNPDRAYDGFILITAGKGYALDSSNNRYDVEEGDILLLRKGDKYELHLPAHSAYITSLYQLRFDNDGEFPIKLPFVIKCSQKQAQSICAICNIWQSHSWDSYTECRIRLLKFYLELLKTQSSASKMDKDIAKAVAYIHENFKKNFSGSDLSKHCSISLSYLRAKFLRQTGYTVIQYRDTLRMANAKEMLESQHFTISEIADTLGYCDIYHFSKAFKKHIGVSPISFGKEMQ